MSSPDVTKGHRIRKYSSRLIAVKVRKTSFAHEQTHVPCTPFFLLLSNIRIGDNSKEYCGCKWGCVVIATTSLDTQTRKMITPWSVGSAPEGQQGRWGIGLFLFRGNKERVRVGLTVRPSNNTYPSIYIYAFVWKCEARSPLTNTEHRSCRITEHQTGPG